MHYRFSRLKLHHWLLRDFCYNILADWLCFDDCTVCFSSPTVAERLRVEISVISMTDYEALHYEKEQLKRACEWAQAGLWVSSSEPVTELKRALLFQLMSSFSNKLAIATMSHFSILNCEMCFGHNEKTKGIVSPIMQSIHHTCLWKRDFFKGRIYYATY